ncbi:penicillin-binding protein 1A [Spirochaetota bacterium]
MKNPKKYIMAILLIIIFSPFTYYIVVYSQSYSLLTIVKEFKPNLSTKIYDYNGELISELFNENRSFIKIKDIPNHVKYAFIATEDRNFYNHRGIDLFGIMRAAIIDILSGDIKQGGSTITQQLVKQLYTKGEKTIRRKIIELLFAQEFEKKFSKDEILEMYLNQIYFGHGVYGIKAASKFYFDKNVKDIGIVESALLASIPSAPNRYSPLRNPHLAFQRNKIVIYNMIYAGYIEKSQVVEKYHKFWLGYLDFIRTRYQTLGIRNKRFDKAPYFTEFIRKKLIKMLGEDRVYKTGLKVYTTLDLRHQKIARETLTEKIKKQRSIASRHNRYRLWNIDKIIAKKTFAKKIKYSRLKNNIKFLKSLREDMVEEASFLSLLTGVANINKLLEKRIEEYDKFKSLSIVEGAFISINPKDGAITSMVGGSDFNSINQLNRAVQSLRQPGSSFKTFVYGAGIESKKITAGTLFRDLPVTFKSRKETWSPSNYGKSYSGKVLVRKAFAASLNIISVLLYQKIGGDQIADFASKIMNIPKQRFEIDPTLTLGTTELSPLEIARGYAVIANNGKEVIPLSIRYINDMKGKTIYSSKKIMQKKKKQIISRATAYIMTSLLRGVVNYGTASRTIRRDVGFKLPAGGKTGTNTDFRDAWFVGFTPDLVAAVWIGCDSQKFTLGYGQAGANVAAPVWGKFMKEIYQFRKKSRFKRRPPNVQSYRICKISGDLPVTNCPTRHEFFIAGTQPGDRCNSDHGVITSIFNIAKTSKEQLKEKEKKKIEKKSSGFFD